MFASRVALPPQPPSVVVQYHPVSRPVDILDDVVGDGEVAHWSEVLKSSDTEGWPRLCDRIRGSVLSVGSEAPPDIGGQHGSIDRKAKLQGALALRSARAGIERPLARLAGQ